MYNDLGIKYDDLYAQYCEKKDIIAQLKKDGHDFGFEYEYKHFRLHKCRHENLCSLKYLCPYTHFIEPERQQQRTAHCNGHCKSKTTGLIDLTCSYAHMYKDIYAARKVMWDKYEREHLNDRYQHGCDHYSDRESESEHKVKRVRENPS